MSWAQPLRPIISSSLAVIPRRSMPTSSFRTARPSLSRSFHPVLPPTRPPPKLQSIPRPPPPRPAKASTSARVLKPPVSSSASSTAGSSTSASTAGTLSSSASVASRKPPNRHMVWYREIVPAMVPILLLSTTVFLTLSLTRTHLSHARSLSESNERIAELEAELQRLRMTQAKHREKERRERERILPMVVERVLQKVGAMSGEAEEEQPMLV